MCKVREEKKAGVLFKCKECEEENHFEDLIKEEFRDIIRWICPTASCEEASGFNIIFRKEV